MKGILIAGAGNVTLDDIDGEIVMRNIVPKSVLKHSLYCFVPPSSQELGQPEKQHRSVLEL